MTATREAALEAAAKSALGYLTGNMDGDFGQDDDPVELLRAALAAIDRNDLNIRVIDQRIGAGIGGMDTVIRVLHVPTGIIVEMPRVSSSQFYDREIALDMIQSALTHPQFRGDI